MKRLYSSIVASLALCPLWAQHVGVVEDNADIEVITPQPLSQDTVLTAIADTLSASTPETVSVLSPDTVLAAPQEITLVLAEDWDQELAADSIPADSIPAEPVALYVPMTELQLAEWTETSFAALMQAVDSVPFDASLVYAQSDLRLPVVVDAKLHETKPLDLVYPFGKPAPTPSATKAMQALDFDNRLARQVAYGETRRAAVEQYVYSHLTSICMVRMGSGDPQPFERRTLERQGIDVSEHVNIGAGLDLGSTQLDIEKVTFHADRWHRKGTTSLQMAQTALSDNWYKGGDNNMTLSTDDRLVFSRYDEDQKTTLDITLDLKLSGYYSAADTINSVRVSNNQFRIDVSYGYKAWKHWYYSTSAYAKTPLLDFHPANSKVTKNTFLSPLEANVSVGLDFKYMTSDKRLNFSLMLAPLAYNLTSVRDKRVNVTSYGIDDDKTVLHQFGSSVTSKLEWRIRPELNWSSRAYYFTTYEKVLVEFENTVTYQVSRHCAAKFYYYPRFDDSRDVRVETKEMLTFGLSLIW